MNKKQLIVAWAITAILCFVILFAPKKHLQHHYTGIIAYDAPLFSRNNPKTSYTIPAIQWDFVLQRSLVILLIGSLLVYTLRDKNK